MINEPRMNISVNMTGQEYMQYKQSKKLKLTKNQKESIIIFSLCGVGALIIGGLISSLTSQPIQSMGYLARSLIIARSFGWLELIKIGLVLAFPFIVISWVLHGIQVRLLA